MAHERILTNDKAQIKEAYLYLTHAPGSPGHFPFEQVHAIRKSFEAMIPAERDGQLGQLKSDPLWSMPMIKDGRLTNVSTALSEFKRRFYLDLT
ncbi:hypothetical protein ACMFMG_006225 [Clarireedia jacksonii]